MGLDLREHRVFKGLAGEVLLGHLGEQELQELLLLLVHLELPPVVLVEV